MSWRCDAILYYTIDKIDRTAKCGLLTNEQGDNHLYSEPQHSGDGKTWYGHTPGEVTDERER